MYNLKTYIFEKLKINNNVKSEKSVDTDKYYDIIQDQLRSYSIYWYTDVKNINLVKNESSNEIESVELYLKNNKLTNKETRAFANDVSAEFEKESGKLVTFNIKGDWKTIIFNIHTLHT